MKIISLVPSITETLFDFGLTSEQVIGKTKFCIHPKNKIKEVPIIGGTKNLHLEKISALKPDLIIANKEENTKEQVEFLMKNHRVWVTDINDFQDNISFIKEMGIILNKEELAQYFIQQMTEILQNNQLTKPLKIAYLIWRNPYMTIGRDTYISSIITQIGGKNCFQNKTRYPEVKLTDLENADIIFLSSEPYPFKEKHIIEIQTQLPNSKVLLVDGEVFSWYGTHLIQSNNYLQNLRHTLE